MSEDCPHLDRRTGDGFDTPRPYCTVAERFVRPLRADVCAARYDLSPAEHCEIYRDHEGLTDPWLAEDPADRPPVDSSDRSSDGPETEDPDRTAGPESGSGSESTADPGPGADPDPTADPDGDGSS